MGESIPPTTNTYGLRHSSTMISADSGRYANRLKWWEKTPQFYSSAPTLRPTPEPLAFADLRSVEPPPRVYHARADLVKEGHPLHPSTWQTPTLYRVGGDRLCFALLFGSYDPALTICRFYKHEARARGQAAALERWRIYGGELEKGNSSGKIKQFVTYYWAAALTAQCKPFRRCGEGLEPLRLQEWLVRDSLRLLDGRDIVLKHTPQLITEGTHQIVPQAKAEALGKFEFGGDVALDVALCQEWEAKAASWRVQHLSQRQLATHRLWKRLPTRKSYELIYHDEAPVFH